MTKEKSRIYFTIDGKTVSGLWSGKASGSGGYVGPLDSSGGHITILVEDGRITSHLTKPPNGHTPIGSTSIAEFEAKLRRALKNIEVNYHGNKKCWVFNPMLVDVFKLQQIAEKGEGADTSVPLDKIIAELLSVIEKNELVQRVRIKSLIDPAPRFAIMETKKGAIDFVLVSKAKVFTISKLLRVAEAYNRNILGLNYLRKEIEQSMDKFMKTTEGRKYLSETRAQVKSLGERGRR